MKKLLLTLIVSLQLSHITAQLADIVTYPQKSQLAWTDFKGISDSLDSTRPFNFSTSILMKSLKANVWTGVTNFEACGYFTLSTSWVLKSKQNAQLLEYLQLQYDIADFIAKKLEKDINAKKINGGNKNKMDKVFKQYEQQLNQLLQKMNENTGYGQNAEKLMIWKSKLSNGNIAE